MPYRKAKCIELHDANTALTTTTNSYALTALSGRGAQASRPAFLVRLADLLALAGRFGFHIPGSSGRSFTRQPEGQTHESENMMLPLFRAYYETPADTEGVQIVTLECDVQESDLVEIRVESRVAGSAPEAANDVQVITYSGSFTIWWDSDRQVDAAQMMAVAEAHPSIPTGIEPEIGVITPAETPIEIDLEDLTGPEVNPP